jgi:transketolase
MTSVDQRCVDTIRFLAVDAVERAKSGHPGMPLGAAPMAYVLWDRFLRHNPANPRWFDRDRFVLSAGHGSALLYALLHVYGYDLPIEQLRGFRQWGSRTAGHPEHGLAPGVEATTGPLGQGFAMGVGMAIAEAHLAATFGADIVDHYTYAICSDGDLMEGVGCEAASLAGTLGLGKIVYLYDDNRITIDGTTRLSFTEDVDRRFEALGWHVTAVEDGNDLDSIEVAIRVAREEVERPSLVRVRTHIGFGSPRQDSAKAHGEPLGAENVEATRRTLGWDLPPFHVPEEVREHCHDAVDRGAEAEAAWNARVETMQHQDPAGFALLGHLLRDRLPDGWDADLPLFDPSDGPMATRAASGKAINALAAKVPTMIGGSADLAGSNKSWIDSSSSFGIDGPGARNINFGVREHAMAAIVNGMALHGGVHPYGATFLVFSDYMRPSIRLAALMGAPSTFVFSHDSVGVGEDGPTHQPVEHLMSLRAIPGLTLLRPADANETAAAWRLALERPGPCVLALTRQKVPVLPGAQRVRDGVARGAYVLADDGDPAVVLIATGSEVHLALEAREQLAERGVEARVVSMPSWEVYFEQPQSYRDDVLPRSVPRVSIEAGRGLGWRDVVGENGIVIGIDRFGESAPGPVVMEKLGLSAGRIAELVRGYLDDPS